VQSIQNPFAATSITSTVDSPYTYLLGRGKGSGGGGKGGGDGELHDCSVVAFEL